MGNVCNYHLTVYDFQRQPIHNVFFFIKNELRLVMTPSLSILHPYHFKMKSQKLKLYNNKYEVYSTFKGKW